MKEDWEALRIQIPGPQQDRRRSISLILQSSILNLALHIIFKEPVNLLRISVIAYFSQKERHFISSACSLNFTQLVKYAYSKLLLSEMLTLTHKHKLLSSRGSGDQRHSPVVLGTISLKSTQSKPNVCRLLVTKECGFENSIPISMTRQRGSIEMFVQMHDITWI